MSRVFAGVPFSTDEQAREILGRRLAELVMEHSLRRAGRAEQAER